MIPINDYVQIEPVEHEDFMALSKTTYDEIGVVLQINRLNSAFKVGDKVYFDSWLASKYPKGNNEYYWLVKYEDIKAYESAVPEK